MMKRILQFLRTTLVGGILFMVTPGQITPANIPPAATLKCLKRLGAGSNPLRRGVSLETVAAK
jgi:hypothetical protein